MSKYHIKYFNDATHRTDSVTLDYAGSPGAAVAAFLGSHPLARTVYQVFEKVPAQRGVRGAEFRVDVGNTARLVFADNAEEAARSVSAQVGKPVRRVWRLAMRHRKVQGRDLLMEAL